MAKQGLHPAAAGAVAAAAWALVEPLDRHIFRCDYSAVALLGKAVTRRRGWWWPIGFAMHTANGAAFGLFFGAAARRVPLERQRLALTLALAEAVALWPLTALVDRHHPGRGEEGIPPLLTNGRAFVQEASRHALFGFLLGRLSRVA